MSLYQINFMLFVFSLTQIYFVNSFLQFPNSCPENVTAMDDFDIKKFLGPWFIYSRFPFIYEPQNGICESVNYVDVNKDNYEIHTSAVDIETETRRKKTIKIDCVTKHGKFSLKRASIEFPLGIDVWVLDTDYHNYAVRYMCMNVQGGVHYKWVAIYTRERLPLPEVVQMAEDSIMQQGIDVTKLKKVDNTACPV